MEAYNLILTLRFGEAQIVIDNQLKDSEDEDFIFYLENLQEFLGVMITEDSKRYNLFRDHFQKRLESFQKTANHDSPYYLFFQAEMHMHTFLSCFKFQDSWKAIIHFYSAYRLIKENNSLFPEFEPNLKVMGIQNIIIGAIPDNYQWVMKITGLKGNETDGVSQLAEYLEYTKKSIFPEVEAAMILAHVHIQNSSHDATALKFLQTIENPPLENPLYRFTYILALNRAGMNHEVIPLVEKYPQSSEEFPFHFLDLLYGEAKLNRLDDGANIPLERFLAEFSGSHYIKSTWHKLSWYYLLKGNSLKYTTCRNKVKTAGTSIIDADKQALFETLMDSIPNNILLTARLLFDGGYYQEAKELLLKNHEDKFYSRPQEKLEYFYRLGRVFHKLNDFEKAKKYYQIVINTGRDIPVYFASFSALQMGKIFEDLGELDQAEFYYRLALELRNGPYKNSIGHKARAALENLKNK